MTTVGLLSDTHSYWDDRYALHFSDCDEIWHAGDIGDITILQRLQDIGPRVRAVSGNIDHGEVRRHAPECLVFDVEGVKVWMSHIGGYPGKYSVGIREMLRANNINLHIAGHSHILKVIPDRELNLLHVNPGAAGVQGWQQQRTLVRLRIDRCKVIDLDVIELAKRYL